MQPVANLPSVRVKGLCVCDPVGTKGKKNQGPSKRERGERKRRRAEHGLSGAMKTC